MLCLSPINIPIDGDRTRRRDVPCGKCVACLSNRRSEWSFRLMYELKRSESAWFVTLTYDDDKYLELHKDLSKPMELSKIDLQAFLKRFRERLMSSDTLSCKKGDRVNLRYFIAGEYGSKTLRPHYHGIFYNIPKGCENLLVDSWGNGFVKFGTVTMASVQYVSGYILGKQNFPEGCKEPFVIMSKRPAIGYDYINRMYDFHKKGEIFNTVGLNGVVGRLPRYFKDKIFNKEERYENYKRKVEEMDRKYFENLERFNSSSEYFKSVHEGKKQLTDKINKRLTKKKL